MSRIVDIENVLLKYTDYQSFSGYQEYDNGFDAGVYHIIDELEVLPVINQERLIILPCRRGAQVYEIVPKCAGGLWCPYAGGLGADRCSEHQCGSYIKACLFDYWMIDKVGKTIFVTREEAEKALANEVETK